MPARSSCVQASGIMRDPAFHGLNFSRNSYTHACFTLYTSYVPSPGCYVHPVSRRCPEPTAREPAID